MARSYRDPLEPGMVVRTRSEWITDETYSEMVQKTPIPCTDAVLTVAGEKAVYLAKRVAYPMAGIWLLGGRIFFNDDSLESSVARCLYLETGIQFSPTRFVCTGAPHLYSWVKVAQGNFGGKNLAITFKLEVTEDELRKIAQGLKATEYDPEFGIQKFTRERLIDERVHPAMLDLFDDIFGKS